MQSYIVYGLTFLFVLILAVGAQKTNKTIYVKAIFILLTFISGFRATSVGIDTSSYARIFNYLNQNRFDLVYEEEGFKYISYVLLKISGNSHTFVFTVYALITNALIVCRLWDFKDVASFKWMVATYYISFFFMTLNVMRQLVAIAILFFATRFVERKKYLIFFIFTAIALLFHTSSIIGVVFVICDLFQWKYLNKKQKGFLSVIFLLLPCLVIFIPVLIYEYGKYFTQATTENVGVMLFVKFAFFVFSSSLLFKNDHYNKSTVVRPNAQRVYKYEVKAVKIYYFIGLAITLLGYFYMYMDRVGLLFYLFECVYFGIIAKNTKEKFLVKTGLFVILAFLFVSSFIGKGQGQMPYYFIWQKS